MDAPGRNAVAHVPSGRATLRARVKNADREQTTSGRSVVEGARFAPPQTVGGRWVGEWIDPCAGAILGAVDLVTRSDGPSALPVPSFSRDVALRLDSAAKEDDP